MEWGIGKRERDGGEEAAVSGFRMESRKIRTYIQEWPQAGYGK